MNRRSLLAAGASILGVAALPEFARAAGEARAPRRDEVSLGIFQYATGEHNLAEHIRWAYDPPGGHVHTSVPYILEVDRPFEFRIEPRWTGGRTDLDVITEVKVDTDIDPEFDQDDGFSNQWASLTHHGPQTRNRELAQVGQHVTMGRGPLLHPMPGRPISYHFRVDFQLGKQNAPKLVAEARVNVFRA